MPPEKVDNKLSYHSMKQIERCDVFELKQTGVIDHGSKHKHIWWNGRGSNEKYIGSFLETNIVPLVKAEWKGMHFKPVSLEATK